MAESKPAARRQHILEQALKIFSVRGYHGTSIRDIARACGISNAALYYHFGSKKDLYFEVLREYIAIVGQKLQGADSGEGTCRQRLARVARVYAQIVLESQNVIQTLVRDLAQFDQEETQWLLPYVKRQIPSVVAAIVEEGMVAGEVRTDDAYRVGVLVLGMLNSLAGYHLETDVEATLEEDVDLAIAYVFDGISI